MEEIIPLPWDRAADYNQDGDFNTEYLDNYDRKIKEFKKKDDEMIETAKSLTFNQLDMVDFLKNFKK